MSQQVTDWLVSLGLGQYATVFEENELEIDQLVDLDDADLRDLGVTVMGHRKKLFRAIKALDSESVEIADGLVPARNDNVVAHTVSEAERRQLTVMFCDLVGSTELSQQFDPEDLQNLITAYQAACNSAIQRFEGYVARYMGDGMLIYFGYPVAHEDDAERAVRSGLAIIDEVAELELPYEITLKVRVGIATGLVVAGDIIGEGASEEHSVLGETPNLAARLQGIAPASGVIISDSTRRLVEGRVEVEVLEPVALKGFSELVQAFQVNEVHTTHRFEAATSDKLSPFVARQSELNLITDRWQQACEGEGQVVLLSGEAGIGKSRILHELRTNLGDFPHSSIRYQCSPYNANTPFYPIIEQIKSSVGFTRDDTDEDRLDKLEYLIGEDPVKRQTDAPLLAGLMSLPTDRYQQLELSPQQLKVDTIAMLVDRMVSLSNDGPVIVIVEDIHWIDPTTLEVFDAFVEVFQKLPVLLVMTHRPGIDKRWEGFGHITQVSLNRLGQREMRALVDRITGGKRLPEHVLEQILQRTDGVPLFVEELIKTLLESELVREVGGGYEFDSDVSSMDIPTTLRDSLMARLDRLAQVKEVAQAASCIGREFSYELLAAITDSKELGEKLDQLVDAGLVFRRRAGDLDQFVFKHALVQDAAYESLLKSRRRELHARIANTLEHEYANYTESVLELLAHHYSEAGLVEPAIDYWLKAGRQSAKQCAHSEAIVHLNRGLALVETLVDGEDKIRSEIEFRVVLGVPLANKEGAASRIVEENYIRAQELCEQLGENSHLYPILWGLWFHHYIGSERRKACDMADRLLEVGQSRGDPELKLEAHHCQWAVQFIGGDLSYALGHCNQGIELYRSDAHHALTFTYGGHDPGVCARHVSGAVLWQLGYPEQSQARFDAAFELARELDHMSTLSTTLAIYMQTCTWRRDEEMLERTAGELIEIARNEKMHDTESIARGIIGWVRFQRGERQQGLEMMQAEQDAWSKTGIAWTAAPTALYAEALAEVNEVERGLELLDQAIAIGDRDDIHWCESELYRVKGNLLLALDHGTPNAAEDAFKKSIKVAVAQNAKLLELRGSHDLARLWYSRGESAQAHKLLESIYQWFTEGHDSRDLIQARQLLDKLAE